MKTLHVNLKDKAYPIYIDEDLLNNRVALRQAVPGKQVLLLSNQTIAPLYLDRIAQHYQDKIVKTLILPDGETYKSLRYLNQIITTLLENQFNRDCCVLAVGGGVIGDMGGFAAACYQRGVSFVQVPTSLLAQVDASIGGKTAVNHRLGKNMIGAFHQPDAVFIDTLVLNTLPDRELRAGMGEVIKYGLIRDPDFFNWLDNHIEAPLKREPDALIDMIERSCTNKAEIVEQDERETGLRAILNLGHTFAHAIETAQSYTGYLHGEAVACGMAIAAILSHQEGWLNQDEVERIQNILSRTGLPIRLPEGISEEKILKLMRVDKKIKAGRIVLVLLQSIGKAILTTDYDQEKLIHAIQRCLHTSR